MYRDEFGDWGTQSLSSNINLLIHSSSWSGSKFGRHDLMACKTISHEVFSFYLSPMGSLVHSLHVEVWPEKPQLAVHPSVGLHTLKQLLGVVENLQHDT